MSSDLERRCLAEPAKVDAKGMAFRLGNRVTHSAGSARLAESRYRCSWSLSGGRVPVSGHLRRLRDAVVARDRFFVFFGVVFFFEARDFALTNRIGGAGATPPGTEYDRTTMPLRASVF